MLLLLLPILLAAGGFYLAYQHGWGVPEQRKTTAHEADPDLKAALEQIDRADPGWQFGDLLDHRAAIPDHQNAATHVVAAAKALPRDWPRQSLVDELKHISQPSALTQQQSDDLAVELKKAAPALVEARKLSDQGTGRYEVAWRKAYLSTEMSHLRQIEAVEQLLRLEAFRAAQEGEMDTALAAARCILDAGRSLGDEPMLESCLIRMNAHLIATGAIERVLAQGSATEAALADTQRLLEDEAARNLLLLAARGERAGLHGLLLALESQELNFTDLIPSENADDPTLEDRLIAIFSDREFIRQGVFDQAHAWLLLYLTEFVEIASLPVEQQRPRIEKLEARRAKAPTAARKIVPPVGQMASTAHQSQALLRCAAAAVAVERFRLAKGRWPEKLTDLAPDYLATVPLDPFDGKPVRFKRQKDGVVVYSIGPDGTDDGGSFETLNAFLPGTDIGFRLWDVDKRRQTVN
jgi:hypothetical protein